MSSQLPIGGLLFQIITRKSPLTSLQFRQKFRLRLNRRKYKDFKKLFKHEKIYRIIIITGTEIMELTACALLLQFASILSKSVEYMVHCTKCH